MPPITLHRLVFSTRQSQHDSPVTFPPEQMSSQSVTESRSGNLNFVIEESVDTLSLVQALRKGDLKGHNKYNPRWPPDHPVL